MLPLNTVVTQYTPKVLSPAELPVQGTAILSLSPSVSTVQPSTAPVTATLPLRQTAIEQKTEIAPAVTPIVLTPASLHTALPLSLRAISLGNAPDVRQVRLIEERSRRTSWSPDGRFLALLSEGVSLYDAETFQLVRTLAEGENIADFAFLPDGKALATAGDGVKVWKVDTGGELQVLRDFSEVDHVAASPDGKTLALGIGQVVKLVDWTSGNELTTFPIGSTDSNIAFSPDGLWLATGGGLAGGDVVTYAVPSGDLGKTMEGHTNWIKEVVYSTDGRVLASASVDGTVKLWEAMTGRLLNTLEGHQGQVGSRHIAGWDGCGLDIVGPHRTTVERQDRAAPELTYRTH